MVTTDDMQQWSYLLNPNFQFINTAGKPLTEGYLEVYIAGTRNKYYCASDFDGTLHPFQIPLDSLGANIVLADPNQAYDVYAYNRFGSLIMSRYNVKPGHGAGGGLTTITITSSDNTVQIDRTGNNYDLSIKDTIDRIDNLEDKINDIKGETSYSVANGYGDNGIFVLTDKESKDITYLNDMSGWRLKPGNVYQLNFNTKFTLDDEYNSLVEGKLYLDGDMSFSQDWSFSLDDSFDHIKHINGSTIIVVPDTLRYYDLALKYTFHSVVNCTVDLENISIVDITSIVKDTTEYYAGDGININNHVISVDMDYINEQINIDEKLSSAVNIANDYTDNSINEVNTTISTVSGDIINYVDNASGDIINYVDNSIGDVVDVIASATATLEQEIQDIPPQVQSDWEQDDNTQVDYIKNKPDELELVAGENISIVESSGTITISASSQDLSDYATHNEVYNSSVSAINSANSYTDTAISNIDFSDYATHNEVYSATSTAIASANSYTDTAIANIDLTPAVEIVSPNNTISVSSVVNSTNNTKTFYIDTNDPETKYYMGESRFTLSDTSSQGTVGYYKIIDDYATRFSGNIDLNNLNKGLYLLTANINCVAATANNDLMELQINSTSASSITYLSSEYPIDCSVVDTYGEPSEISHQIATLVRVVYDGSKLNLVARIDDPTTVSNVLNVWVSDLCLYEIKTNSGSSSSSPSASGSYEEGWGIVINGNVISVNQSIIPDVSNFATETYVNNRIASAVNIVESEIPDVSDMATRTWVNSQGYITTIPSYYATETEVSDAIATAINSIPEQVNADWNSTSGKSEILNKPETIDVDVCPIIAGNGISITASGDSAILTCTVPSGESYSAGNGINITNNTISIDNTVALKSEIPDVSSFVTSNEVSAIVGAVSSVIENDIPDTSDMATKTWVGNQGYLTSVPSQYITETELSSELADYALKTDVPNPVSGASGVKVEDSIVSLDNPIGLIAGENITITVSGDSAIIAGQAGGSSYTAGTGIDITSDVISIDDSVVVTKTWIGNQDYVNSSTASAIAEAEVANIDVCPILAGENITITASGSSAVIASQVISVPSTTNLDTTKHYYLAWDNTNGIHWEVGDLGEIETALANL